jgi:hypothetical protein
VVALLFAGLAELPDPLWWAASLGLLASSLVAVGLWLGTAVRDRLPEDAVPAVRPHPSGPVTRRFRRTASLRIEPEDVVVVDGLGRERRLPRTGTHGVTTAAVVRAGTPHAQLELRTASGTPRATLPWREWFGGAGGDAALETACASAGLPLERRAAPARRPETEEQTARLIYSPPRREFVAASTWPHGLPGQAAVWQTAPFASFLLIYSLGGGAPAGAQWALVATLLLTAVPQVVRLLGRRVWLDVPVRTS